jgi:hypothetical protein
MASYPTCYDSPVESTTDEPSIEELLAEPIIQLVMQRDGVKANEMRHTFDRLLMQVPA